MTFTCRNARSAAVLVLVFVTVVETTFLHAILVRHVPLLAYLITATSIGAIAWLITDYVVMGRQALRIEDDTVDLRIGLRVRGTVPRAAIAAALSPSWRDLGASAPRYLNATKPATPNVMIVLEPPQAMTIVGALRRPVERVVLHADDPAGLIASLAPVSTA